MSTRRPKYEGEHDGTRVRVFATRTDLEVIYGDADIDDPDADVMVYPKRMGPAAAAMAAVREFPPMAK